MKTIALITLMFSLITLASCSGTPESTSEVSEDTKARPVEEISKSLMTLSPTPTQYVPTQTPSPAKAVETPVSPKEQIPMHVERALKRLSFDLAIPETNFTFIKSAPTDWPDTSLGCPEADYLYAQVITPGHKVTFEFEGTTYMVHTDKDGSNTARCDVIPPFAVSITSTPTPTPTP